MISLLAQIATSGTAATADTAPLQLPSVWHGIAIVSFGGIVVLIFVLAIMLRSFRSFRADIAKEIKSELASDDKTKRVDVQSPLTVRAHTEYATVDQINKLEGDIERFREETNTALHDLRLERSRSTGNLHSRIEETDKSNQRRMDELRKELSERIDALPARILTIINESRKI